MSPAGGAAMETVAMETVTSEADRPHFDLDTGKAKGGTPHFSSMSLACGVFGLQDHSLASVAEAL